MKKFIKGLFNTNTGYFINTISYYYECKYYTGYILCKGFIIFGIPGYDRIEIFLNKNDAETSLNNLK